MAKRSLVFANFEGGLSTDSRMGLKNSQAYSQSLDFRKSPSQISVLPGPVREDNNIVKDLVLNEIMAPNGVIYAVGNAGYFYKRITSGVWSTEGKLDSGTAGLDYRKDTDSIYATANKTVALYAPVTGTNPTFYSAKYGVSYTTYNNSPNIGFNVSAYQVGSNQTTLLGTSILEGPTNLRYFESDIEPLSKISVFITNKGTGNWTLTLHDGLNNVLATSTVSNANLNNNSWNDFAFTTAPNGQVRIYVAPNARTYHIHLTSTVADGTVSSSAINDLSTMDLMIYADRLVQTNNGLHPIQRFLQYETIGNGNYLSVWEPISDPPTNDEWKRHALVFPEEYEVCGLTVQNEFLIIAAEKNTTVTGFNPQSGILFFWDGVSPTYNYFVEIPEGSPQCIHTYKNVTYYYAAGAWYGITSPTTVPVKLRTFPGSDTEFSGTANSPISIYPYAATVRRGVQLMAYPSVSTNSNVNFGIYSYGAVDKNYPDSFGYSYLMSTGSKNYTAGNNLQIGCVQSFGDLLHISWRDDLNGGYGVDIVNNASGPASYALWQSLVFDGGYAAKQKTANYMEIYYYIPDSTSVKIGYSIDNGAFVTSPQYSNTTLWEGTSNYARLNIPLRFHEIQLQFEVFSPSGVITPPVIQMVSLVYDDNTQEVLA